MKKNKSVLGFILVIASAIIFGCMPLITRFIYAEGVNSFSLVFLRNLLSLPMLALAAKASGGKLKINFKALPSIGWIAAMGCCITPMLLYTSYNDINTGMATVFHFIYPAVVMVLSLLFLKSKFKLSNIIILIICIAGICMFYTPGAEARSMGSVLALLSGVTYAIYIVGLTGFRYKEIAGFVFTFYGAAFCSILSFVICICSGQLSLPTSPKGWILCTLFALIFNVGAVVLFQRGTTIIGGEKASILSTFEPITGIVVGIAFLNENGGINTIIGTILVVAASVLITVFDMKRKNE